MNKYRVHSTAITTHYIEAEGPEEAREKAERWAQRQNKWEVLDHMIVFEHEVGP